MNIGVRRYDTAKLPAVAVQPAPCFQAHRELKSLISRNTNRRVSPMDTTAELGDQQSYSGSTWKRMPHLDSNICSQAAGQAQTNNIRQLQQ